MFGLFESKKSKIQKSHFRNLIGLACVDGDFDENEKQFLIQTGIRWGLSREQVDCVLDHPDRVAFVLPDNGDDRLHQLTDLIVMMMADGEIVEAEMDYVQALAVRMGFRASDVPKMLAIIVEAIRANSRPEIDADGFLDA